MEHLFLSLVCHRVTLGLSFARPLKQHKVTGMRLFVLLVLLFGMSTGSRADESEPKGVIRGQIEAFQVNDLDTAFSFASPTIQKMFGSAKRFGQMVKSSYPMIWRPSDVRFGGFSVEGDKQVQTVFITDNVGSVFEARYEMLATDTGWHIGGVYVRQTGVGA